MQYHLNGFSPGDPAIKRHAGVCDAAEPTRNLPEDVDVLIVGCGPAGLTLATQLAAFPDIKTCIVDQKSGPLLVGQADGIACRTVEMFEAFGFSEKVLKEAYWVNETSFWKPDETDRQKIARSSRIQDTEDGLSEFPHVILSQARVHDFYLEAMCNSPAALEPHYSRELVDLEIDRAGLGTHPVRARFKSVDPRHGGRQETVRARYVIGCDGARSAVRTSLGLALHGDSANQAWGVMDVLATTDFPDIRLKSVIHSAGEGNLLIIPREGGYMVRMYIELDKLNENERVSARNLSSDHLISAAQRILNPYKLEVKEVAWWSVYEIGQRLCDRFDDADKGEGATQHPCAFIAGDACHTHSPKAGQGMNVSMADAFNLGWKLASALLDRTHPDILQSYSAERQAIANELIGFDREFAKMFSAKPKAADDTTGEGIDPAEFQQYFVRHGRFTAGTATRYAPSLITAEPGQQHLAKGLTVGMRFHSAPVVRLADAKPMHLGHTIKADGRWRIMVFADARQPTDKASGVFRFCDFLANSASSPIARFTPAGADPDSVIDVRVIFQQAHHDLAVEAMHRLLLPAKGKHGLKDHEKMFCPDFKGGTDIFDMREIDRQGGCMAIVRPDQYVASILPLNAHADLTAFFGRFMTETN